MIAVSILLLALAANIAHAQPIAPPALPAPATGQQLSATAPSTSPPDGILDTADKVLAYLVGAAWVYYNDYRGRTYRARLEAKLSGAKLGPDPLPLAKITAQVKNVSLAKCTLLDYGSGLRVQGYDTTKLVDHWVRLGTYTILTKNNQWIEPGVTIEEQILLPIDPGKYAAYRADLILDSGKVRWKMAAIF